MITQTPRVLPSLASLTPSDAWRAIGLGIGTILWYAGFLAIPAVTYIAGIAVWSWLNAAYLVFLLGHLLWYNAGLAPPPKAALLPYAKVGHGTCLLAARASCLTHVPLRSSFGFCLLLCLN